VLGSGIWLMSYIVQCARRFHYLHKNFFLSPASS